MIHNIYLYFKDGTVVTWLYEIGAVMQCLRVAYPDTTIIRMNGQSYIATFKGSDDTIMGTPRQVAEAVLNRDESIERIDWGDLEDLV